MDLTTFDVTDHPTVGRGAWLEVIGPACTPDDVAAAAGTNGYEVLTSLGRRFHRVYHGRRERHPRHCRGGRPRRARRLPRCRGAGAVRSRSACRTCCARRSTGGCSLRALLEIGYFSLPVVALTAMFTGMVLALQSYTGFSRFSAESAIAEHRRAVGHPRAGAGAGRADGGRAHRRGDGGRDRHHARHRPDRRADHAVHQPDEIPGRAAPAGRHHRVAAAGGGGGHPGRAGRLHRVHAEARLQPDAPTCTTRWTSCRRWTWCRAW